MLGHHRITIVDQNANNPIPSRSLPNNPIEMESTLQIGQQAGNEIDVEIQHMCNLNIEFYFVAAKIFMLDLSALP